MNGKERLAKEAEMVALCGQDFIRQCLEMGLNPVTIGLVMAQQGAAMIYKYLSGEDAFKVVCSLCEAVGSKMHTDEWVSESLAEIAVGEKIH
jgi:hypothetical protein